MGFDNGGASWQPHFHPQQYDRQVLDHRILEGLVGASCQRSLQHKKYNRLLVTQPFMRQYP